MRIPFVKAHGAHNDFLLTWQHEAPAGNHPEIARTICDRHTGVGADGWILIATDSHASNADGHIRLYNSDGSEPEMSGNGTRCAAAFLIDCGLAQDHVKIRTGAGVKELRLIERSGLQFRFEMNMGRARFEGDGLRELPLRGGSREVTLVNVGNPQCALVVKDFDLDWRSLGAEIERHAVFPNRTNVSFLRRVDEHTIEVRFWERGAGETMSSGTGATGAAAAAHRMGLVGSPVTVLTPAGPLHVRLEDEIYLTGPAQIIAGGVFYP